MVQRSKRDARAAKIVPVFLGFFILIGAVALGVGVWNLYRSLDCEHWPATEGVVDRAEMKYQSNNKGGGSYSADVSYHYEVSGTNYSGKRLAFGTMSSSASYAQAILARYPAGKKISVYYSPNDPELAVLETGIHGGTWICFGVGTVFILFGAMFLKIFRMALAAQNDSMPPRTVGRQNPPVLMGVIFIVMGSSFFFMEPSPGVPKWVAYAAAGMFVLAGLWMLANRLQNKIYSKVLIGAAMLAFLAVFNWVSFAPGERMGTVTSTFSSPHPANVKPYFAAFTVVLDLALLAGLARRLVKGPKG
jgi:hypothetical protein